MDNILNGIGLMLPVQQLHQKAMEFTELAFIARMKGDTQQAREYFEKAFKNESSAADLVRDNHDFEPTRSVLYRSAATLAIDCGKILEAEKLVAIGLEGDNIPVEIAEELRDLGKQSGDEK